MQQMILAVGRLLRRDEGQDLLEYGLVAVLIAIVAIGAVTTVGDTVKVLFWDKIAKSSF